MRVTFVLPNPIRIPMGGAKVVYAHARELVALGHRVQVVAPRQSGTGLRAWAMRTAIAVRDRLHGVAGTHEYEAAGVETLDLPSPEPRHFPESDVVIATGVQTAPWVEALGPEHGRPLYFVQGDETFVRPDARDSWHIGLPLITCAAWLADAMREAGLDPLAVVPNAIDPEEFGLDQPIAGRAPRILSLYHRHPVKGPDVLLDALAEVRRQRADVQADLFCARPPSHAIPDWVRVHIRPSPGQLRELYNQAGILLHPSRSEGWPLVPMEAAACGAAVVASANPGVREVLENGVSMRGVAVGDGRALGAAALDLLATESERVRLAEAARQSVAQLSWRDSTARLETVLSELVA